MGAGVDEERGQAAGTPSDAPPGSNGVTQGTATLKRSPPAVLTHEDSLASTYATAKLPAACIPFCKACELHIRERAKRLLYPFPVTEA